MGEAAEAALNGECCQYCGEWFHCEEGPGYPRSCAACGGDNVNKSKGGKKARKKRQRIARSQRRRYALETFEDTASKNGWSKLSDFHFRKKINGKNLDHWPSTGKYSYAGTVFVTNNIEKWIAKNA